MVPDISPFMQQVLNIVGWLYLPDLITKNLLATLHQYIWPSIFRTAPPVMRSPAYYAHHRRTFAFVVLGYLTFTLYQSSSKMEPNFYQVLGVPPYVDDNGLKLAFRHFAKRNHPDRPGVGIAGAEKFMMVRDVYEALKDPVVRFAYDRFGPVAVDWRSQCSTRSEYMWRGLWHASGYHIVSGAGLILWGALGKPSPVAFWRYMLFVTLFASELALFVLPSPTASMTKLFPDPSEPAPYFSTFSILFPNRVAFQHVFFLHQLFLMLGMALNQLGPRLFPDIQRDAMPTKEELKKISERMTALAAAADREVSVILHTDLHAMHHAPADEETRSATRVSMSHIRPFVPTSDHTSLQALTKEIENMYIESSLRQEAGPLRIVWEGAIARGRRAAGLGRNYYNSSSLGTPSRPSFSKRRTSTKRTPRGGQLKSSVSFVKENNNDDRDVGVVDVDALLATEESGGSESEGWSRRNGGAQGGGEGSSRRGVKEKVLTPRSSCSNGRLPSPPRPSPPFLSPRRVSGGTVVVRGRSGSY